MSTAGQHMIAVTRISYHACSRVVLVPQVTSAMLLSFFDYSVQCDFSRQAPLYSGPSALLGSPEVTSWRGGEVGGVSGIEWLFEMRGTFLRVGDGRVRSDGAVTILVI